MKFIHAFSLLTLLLLLLSAASVPVCAQCVGMGCDGPIREVYLICCNEPVYNAGEEGVGTDHSKDCRDYVRNRASPETRRSICNQVNSKGLAGLACPAAAAACDSPNGKSCGDNMPEKGLLYAGTLDGRIYSEPSTSSPLVGSPPSGTRLKYTNTTQVNGQTWYHIESPGRANGWMPGSQLSCTRPEEPPPPRRIFLPDKFHGRAALASAGRG